MTEWKFYPITTDKGGFQTTAYGYAVCEFNYVVLAEKETNDHVFIGIYGYGNTPEEAMDDAKEKVNKL